MSNTIRYIILLLTLWGVSMTVYSQSISLSHSDYSYTIHYECPNIDIINDTIECNGDIEVYSRLEFNNDIYDYINDDLKPEIPFVSLNLILPDDADYVDISLVSFDLEYMELPRLYVPASLGDRENDEGASEGDSAEAVGTINIDTVSSLCADMNAYADACYNLDRDCSSNWFTVSDIYTMMGGKGVTVTFFPFQYHVEFQEGTTINSLMNYVSEAEFEITYTCTTSDCVSPVTEQTQDLNTLHEDVDAITFRTYDNYRYDEPINVSYPAYTYLIIANQDYLSDLSTFVSYKQSLGYNVDVVSTDVTGNDPEQIREFLVDYRSTHSLLRYVLLVDDINGIPFSDGEEGSMLNPPTDVYYTCLDYYKLNHQSDLHPDVYLGRWLVTSPEDVSNIIEKTIRTETNLYTYNITHKYVCLFSGSGCWSLMFYNNIKKLNHDIFTSNGYYSIAVDGRVADEPTHYAIQNALNGSIQYPWILYYNGHSYNFGYGEPYKVSAYILSNRVHNSSFLFFPFAFTTSCETANLYESDANKFINTWLCNENGGVSILASTVNVLTAPANKYYEYIFKPLKNSTHPNMPVGSMVWNGGSNYYHADKVGYRRNQYKKMIFFGDPSLMIHGNSVSQPRRMKEYNEAPETNISEINDLFNQMGDENIIAVNLYSVSGKLLKEYSNIASLEQDFFARGLYILSIRTDNNQYTIKYYR